MSTATDTLEPPGAIVEQTEAVAEAAPPASARPRLDEQARRKPGFTEGLSLTLGDGQAWTFPKLLTCYRPVVLDDGSFGFGHARTSLDDTYDERLEVYLTSEDGVEQAVILLNLAAGLLGRNYDLAPADFARLLPRISGDRANEAMWEGISCLVLGIAPESASNVPDAST